MTAKALALRGARLWLLIRLVLLVLIVVPAIEFHPLAVTTALGVVALATGIGLVEVSIRGDRHILGNLGVSRGALLAMVATPALVGEMLVLLGASMFLA